MLAKKKNQHRSARRLGTVCEIRTAVVICISDFWMKINRLVLFYKYFALVFWIYLTVLITIDFKPNQFIFVVFYPGDLIIPRVINVTLLSMAY